MCFAVGCEVFIQPSQIDMRVPYSWLVIAPLCRSGGSLTQLSPPQCNGRSWYSTSSGEKRLLASPVRRTPGLNTLTLLSFKMPPMALGGRGGRDSESHGTSPAAAAALPQNHRTWL